MNEKGEKKVRKSKELNVTPKTPRSKGGLVLDVLSNVITAILIVLVLFLLFLNLTRTNDNGINIGKYNLFRVITGSMAPDIKEGDMVVVKTVPIDEINVGDIITYRVGGDRAVLLTHRVVNVFDGGEGFITKADYPSNAVEDPAVKAEYVIGKHSFTIPFAGRLLNLFESRSVWIIVPLIFIALVIMLEVVKSFLKKSKARPKPSEIPVSEDPVPDDVLSASDKNQSEESLSHEAEGEPDDQQPPVTIPENEPEEQPMIVPEQELEEQPASIPEEEPKKIPTFPEDELEEGSREKNTAEFYIAPDATKAPNKSKSTNSKRKEREKKK